MPRIVQEQYKEIINRYIQSQSEQDLYAGQLFSRRFIEKNISPEEVISIHKTTLQEILEEVPEEIWHSFNFLIEMMIHYGLALREHQSLILKQEELAIEMKLAIQMQETLLKTKAPNFEKLDIGFLSLPAKAMSGDYIYFVSEDTNHASVAVADVIGKGIPAALCMSMIKFTMDSIRNQNINPNEVLKIVNRVVEESISDSMFISMFYGKYVAATSEFIYASAGHEPAIMYIAKEDKFVELHAEGLLLGVQSEVQYEERQVLLEDGDFIMMMTDGVTETRSEEEFISHEEIICLLEENKSKPAQQIVDALYQYLGGLQEFNLFDDFTIVIFKKDDNKLL